MYYVYLYRANQKNTTMKKHLSLTIFLSCVIFCTSAQSGTKASYRGYNATGSCQKDPVATHSEFSTAKTTSTPPREYNHFDFNAGMSTFDTTGGTDFHMAIIWIDSTITQSYVSGPGAVEYSSVAQVIYPFDSIFNNTDNPANVGLMRLTKSDSYKIDSVKIRGIYLTGSTKSTSIVDTLIISLTSQPGDSVFSFSAGIGSTIRTAIPLSVDSINKAALAFTGTPARAFWKVPLTASMRSPAATAPIVTWAFAPPGSSYAVPAGNVPVVTYAFKSGDTWIANVDNVDSFHRFMPLFGGTANVMPYSGYSSPVTDRSMSSLLHSKIPGYYGKTRYSSSVELETESDISFAFEYLAASFVVSCPSCHIVTRLGIEELTNVSAIKVFPNPSSEKVNISFIAKEIAPFTISITNTLGQVVATQDLSIQNAWQTVHAAISTANLPTGIYIYTIESNGERTSNRLSIVH